MSIEELFPNLATCEYKTTSEKDRRYNCIAWAVGINDRWWEPVAPYYWPLPHPMWATVENLKAAYAVLGYVDCGENASLEADFEKVAIYSDGSEYMHASRQLESGWWASKLGFGEDIEHRTLAGLSGEEYGEVACIMRRPKARQQADE
jgi:hypothetical protein